MSCAGCMATTGQQISKRNTRDSVGHWSQYFIIPFSVAPVQAKCTEWCWDAWCLLKNCLLDKVWNKALLFVRLNQEVSGCARQRLWLPNLWQTCRNLHYVLLVYADKGSSCLAGKHLSLRHCLSTVWLCFSDECCEKDLFCTESCDYNGYMNYLLGVASFWATAATHPLQQERSGSLVQPSDPVTIAAASTTEREISAEED